MILNDVNKKLEIPQDIKVERFDMAVNFYELSKINDKIFLKVYEYNPVWKSWFPFYDDVNKSPMLYNSKAKTYGELIDEFNNNYVIDINEKLEFAKDRYFELTKKEANNVKSATNFIVYELKFSKTANAYTLYKLFNYIIFCENKDFESDMIDVSNMPENLVENAKYFLDKEINNL